MDQGPPVCVGGSLYNSPPVYNPFQAQKTQLKISSIKIRIIKKGESPFKHKTDKILFIKI